jgi:hypothetical protein
MSNPEIKPMLLSIGWEFAADVDGDGNVTGDDFVAFTECMSGPLLAMPPDCDAADFDADNDADLVDLRTFQHAFGTQ